MFVSLVSEMPIYMWFHRHVNRNLYRIFTVTSLISYSYITISITNIGDCNYDKLKYGTNLDLNELGLISICNSEKN